ncbi:hypothetical protein NU219Hw_g1443t1 [Hortaea werneckii]
MRAQDSREQSELTGDELYRWCSAGSALCSDKLLLPRDTIFYHPPLPDTENQPGKSVSFRGDSIWIQPDLPLHLEDDEGNRSGNEADKEERERTRARSLDQTVSVPKDKMLRSSRGRERLESSDRSITAPHQATSRGSEDGMSLCRTVSETGSVAAPRLPAKSEERARRTQQMRLLPVKPDATIEPPSLVLKGSQVYIQDVLDTHANDPKPPLPLRSPLRESIKGLDIELLASALPGFYDVSRAGTNLFEKCPEEATSACPEGPHELSVDSEPLSAAIEEARPPSSHLADPESALGSEKRYCAQQSGLPDEGRTSLAKDTSSDYEECEPEGESSKHEVSEEENAIDLLKPRERAARRPKTISNDEFFRGWNHWWDMNLHERQAERDTISQELLRFTWPVVKEGGEPPQRPNEPGSPGGTAKKRPGPWTFDLRRLEYMDLM